MADIELTDRERLIAKEAAKLALEELSGEFYKRVGKTIVEKILIWIGMLVVGYVFGKGWIIKSRYAQQQQEAAQFHGGGGQQSLVCQESWSSAECRERVCNRR